MCIRDRYCCLPEFSVDFNGKDSNFQPFMFNDVLFLCWPLFMGFIISFSSDFLFFDEETLISRMLPVSYTHLDVYKRQGPIPLISS